MVADVEQLAGGEAVLVRVLDNGLGRPLVSPAPSGGHGLLGMRERLPNSFVAAEVMPFEGAAAPGTFIVFGGANCEGVMGAQTVRSFPFTLEVTA